jgi:hypothetical protein
MSVLNLLNIRFSWLYHSSPHCMYLSGLTWWWCYFSGSATDALKFEQQFTSSTQILSSLSSPVRTLTPISPILSNSLVNVPARFLPQPTLEPRRLLAVPGTQNPFLSANMLRSHSTRRHLSVKVCHTRRASEPIDRKA